jgi:hypothetical protein
LIVNYQKTIKTMKTNAKTRTEQILTVLNILAWVAFVGFLIEAGAILFSYGVSLFNPEGAKNLYNGLDLHRLMKFNFWHYTLSVSFRVAILIMKSMVWLLVIKTLSAVSLTDPFKMEIAQKLESIAYMLFATWVVGMTSAGHMAWLQEISGETHGEYVSGEFIFWAGLVYIISQVFKRGVEIQSENELTV